MLFRGAFQAFLSAAIILAVDDVGGVLEKAGKRELGPRKKNRKSSKTFSPTTLLSTCEPPDFLGVLPTSNFKVIQSLASEPAVVIGASTFTESGVEIPSLVGSKLLFTAPLFCPNCVTFDDNFDITGYFDPTPDIDCDRSPIPDTGTFFPGEIPPAQLEKNPSTLTVSCEFTEGTTTIIGPDVQPEFRITKASCDITWCITFPFIGGCAFFQSGGSAVVDELGKLPLITATQTGGTGLFFFGEAGFATLEVLSGDLLEGTALLNFGYNGVFDEGIIFFRNLKIASTVPGFIPVEGEFDPDDLEDLDGILSGRKLSDTTIKRPEVLGC